MKKLIFFVFITISLFTQAQSYYDSIVNPDKVSILFESNVSYSPIGFKVIFQNAENGYGGYYFTCKISDDLLTRVKTDDDVSYDPDMLNIDFNKLIIGGGAVFNIAQNIDFYIGSGIMTGAKYVLSYTRINIGTNTNPIYAREYGETWDRTNATAVFPMLSSGLILTKNKMKFSIGNETAFTTDDHFNSGPNKKAITKLSSYTFGIGYAF